MEGFFDGVNVVFVTPAPSIAAHKALAKTPTPSAEPVPREGTHVEGVGETTPLSAEDPFLQREPFLLPLFKLRSLLPFCRLLFRPVNLLQLSPRLQRAMPLLLLLLPPFPAPLHVGLIRTYPQRDPMIFWRIPMMRPS